MKTTPPIDTARSTGWLLFLAVLLFVGVPDSHAQTADDLMDQFLEAWNDEDPDAISDILAEDVIYWDANTVIEGKEEVAASWASSMEAADRMTLTTIRTEKGEDLAYHAGRWEQFDDDGQSTAQGTHTFVFTQADEGEWRITSAHVEEADSDAVEDNVALIRGAYEAFAEGDVPAVLEIMDPEIRWTEAEGFPYAGTYVGPDAVLENVFELLGSEWDDYTAAPTEYVADGEKVIALGEYSGTYLETGEYFEAPFAHVWTIEDGRATRFIQITDTELVQRAVSQGR